MGRVKGLINLCLLFIMLLGATTLIQAQDDESNPKRGVYLGASYNVSDTGTVNATTGNVLLNIPLASLPPGRGGLSAGVSLVYNSKLYDVTTTEITDENPTPHLIARQHTLMQSEDGGWRYAVGYRMIYTQDLGDACALNGFVNRVEMDFPDGSRHEFRPYGYQSHHDLFQIQPDGWISKDISPNSCHGPRLWTTSPMTYYSTDGTYMRLEFAHDSDENPENNPWVLYMPDGGRVVATLNGGNLDSERIYDRNNNYVDIQFSNAPVETTTITDQEGRSITIQRNVDGGLYTQTDYVTTKGFNGEDMRWTISWKSIHVFKNYQGCTGQCVAGALDSLDAGLLMVNQITLPAQSGGLTYTFGYNAKDYVAGDQTLSDGWGEISSVTLPSGAQAAYHYTYDGVDGISFTSPLHYNFPTEKTLTYQLEYDGATTSQTDHWLYSINTRNASGIQTNTSTVTAPDGGVTKDYFYPRSITPAIKYKSNLVYKSERPDGSVVENLWRPNTPAGVSPYDYYSGPVNEMNPILKTEYTSLRDASGILVKTAIKDYSYDKNGNITRIDEYDWVGYNSIPRDQDGYPTGIPDGAEPSRVTVNAYYNQTPDASDTSTDSQYAYYRPSSPQFHKAVKSTSIGPSATSVTSYAEYQYDDPNTTANLTQQSVWDSTKGAVTVPLTASNSVSTSTQYDQYGNATLKTDARGVQTQYTYGNITGPNGVLTGLYPTGTRAALGKPEQRTTTQEYDFYSGLVTRATDVDNNVSEATTYDVFGRPILIKSAEGKPEETRSSTTYDDVNRRVISRSDLNSPGDARIVSIQHFDQLGRVRLTQRLEDALTESETVETTGIKVQTRYLTDSVNHVTYQLTSNPYRAATSSAAGGEATMGWTRSKSDSGGRAVEGKTFSGSSLPAPWGSNASSTGTVSMAYDANCTTVTDQAGKVRRSVTNALGQLVRVDEPDSSGSLGGTSSPTQATNYTYDALGNLTQVSQGAQTRTFSYNSLSRLTSATNPEVCDAQGTPIPTTYQYDANGNLLVSTDARGVSKHYSYDGLNRVTRRWYNGSSNITSTTNNSPTLPAGVTASDEVTYFYDSQSLPAGAPSFDRGMSTGRLVAVLYGGANSTTGSYVGYDDIGRVKRSIQRTNDGQTDQTYSLSNYDYDLAGNLKSETYPSGRIILSEYDQTGRLAGVKNQGSSAYYVGTSVGDTNPDNHIQYAANGTVKSMKLGNGLWEHTTFNSRLQLTEIGLGTTISGTDKLKLTYTYTTDANTPDNNGNVRSQTITVPGLSTPIVQTYGYDSLNRLQSMNETGGLSQTFGYDRYGNRIITAGFMQDAAHAPHTTAEKPAVPDWFDQNNNRLKTQKYDSAGNVIKDTTDPNPGNTFDYDAENKQTRYNGGAAADGTDYKYDGDGRRVKKVIGVGQHTTIFVYDAMGQMVAEYDTNTPEPGSGGTSYFTEDNLGTPRIITGADQNVKARHDYLPFGEEIGLSGGRTPQQGYVGFSDNVRQKFTQKERDIETGLDYFGARYYSTAQGRFTNPDPLLDSAEPEQPQTWNRYAYVLNNPLKFVDPNGLRYVQRTLSDGSIQYAWCATDACFNHAVDKNSKDYEGWVAVTFPESKPFEYLCRGCGGGR